VQILAAPNLELEILSGMQRARARDMFSSAIVIAAANRNPV
jgi:hypothetical protein